jgi:raffinose/stachyose/melibiose transport system substrate-binding protein
LNPPFRYSHRPFPGGDDPAETHTYLNLNDALGVNAHASAQLQTAAQTFIDFVARPEQSALYAQTTGGMTQYQFQHDKFPTFMSRDAPLFEHHQYVIDPIDTWWNASVLATLQENQIGLITGQRSIDDVLNAMDEAWALGPQ